MCAIVNKTFPGFVVVFFLSIASVWAHSPEPVAEAELHRPLAVPDRIVLTWTDDPATSQAVTWRTAVHLDSIDHAVAELTLATVHGGYGTIQGMRDSAVVLPATSEVLETDLGAASYHSVEFKGLLPETLYAYRVGDGINWSEWFQFRTASRQRKPFKFIYFGDAQNELKSQWSRVVRQAYTHASDARFFIHAGDLINTYNRDADWGEWFYAAGWINGMLPSIVAAGNHEYGADELGARNLSAHWRSQFTLPEHGPQGLEESVYYTDYQGVRIVVLNSNEALEAQAAWLDGVLSDNPQAWTVLTFHHPVFSSAQGRDNEALRALWQPIIDQHEVDLVLQGHDHTYARSRNVRDGMSVRDDRSGTVYVVSVSGPKMYESSVHPLMRRVAEDTQLYQVVEIDGGELVYRAYMATGELYDAFNLSKRENSTNTLQEKMPRGARERRRVKTEN
jgi:3',5'-cyclic AMP phosphodiesterase CpdA